MSKVLTANVEALLAENERLRNSDIYLLFAYWERHDGLQLTNEQKLQLRELTNAESITRRRREMRDKYPGDDETESKRFTKYIEARDEYGYKYMKEV